MSFTDFFNRETYEILEPYLGIAGFSGIWFYILYHIFRGSNFDFYFKIFCIIAFLFILVLLGGHIYYLSGLFDPY